MVGLGVLSPQVSGGQKVESGGKTGGFMKTLSQMEKNVPLFNLMIMMIPGGSLNHACQGANTYAIPLLTGVTSRSGSISRQRKYP